MARLTLKRGMPSPRDLTSTSLTADSKTSVFQNPSRAADEHRRKIASWGLNAFQMAKTDRWRQERQWYLNLAFYFGQQHVTFRGTQNQFQLYQPPAPYYRVRPVINHVRRIIRKDIARLTAQRPNAYVVPASSEDRDMFAAQAGEQIWDSIYREHSLKKTLRSSVYWATVLGNGFTKQYWDDDKKDPGNPDINEGSPCFVAPTPFHIFIPDLKEEDLEDEPFMLHANIKPREWVKRYYKLDVLPEFGLPDFIDESFLNVIGANQFSSKDQVLLLEVYVKPGATSLIPDGGWFTICGPNIVGGAEGMPYSHGQYPFSKIDMIPTGKFYSESIITDLIPLQRELNRTRGQIIEAKNRMSKPQLAAEEGSLDPTKVTSEPGQVVLYRAGFNPPTPIPMQDLPSYVVQEVDRIMVDMGDLSGQHEVSKGQVPPGVTAATAISYLQEHDESILSTAYDSVEESIEKTARQTLNMVKDYWTIERTIKVTGIDGSFDAMAFRGSDLRDNTDIRVEGGSALPTSKAAKQAYIMDLMKMNFIPPEEGLGVLEMGGLNKIYERIQVDIRQVQRENLKMSKINEQDVVTHMDEWEAKKQERDPATVDPETQSSLEAPPLIPVNTYDNHPVHIEYHNRYRKSQAFEILPPHVKAIFEEHVKMHEMVLAGQAAMNANPLDPAAGQGGPEGANMGAEGPGAELQPPGSGQPGPSPMPELSGGI